MADISFEVERIQEAHLGREARQPISNALKKLYDEGYNASKLSGYTADDLVPQLTMSLILPIDSYPKKSSTHLVSSHGLRALFGDIENADFNMEE